MTIPALILLAVAIAVLTLIGAAYAWRSRLPSLPPWGWRNIVALIAVFAQIAAAGIITALVWTIINNLGQDADRLLTALVNDRTHVHPEIGTVLVTIYQTFKTDLILLTAGLLCIIIGFGFAITARRFSGEWLGGKVDFSGGDNDDDPPSAAEGAARVAGAASSEAAQVANETIPGASA